MSKILFVSALNPVHDVRIFYKEILTLNKLFSVEYMVQNDQPKSYYINGVKIIPLPISKGIIKRIFLQQPRIFIHIYKNSYDVIQFNSPELILLMFFIRLFLGKRILYDIHESVAVSILDKAWIPAIIRPFVSWSYSIIEKLCIKSFTKLILAEKSYKNIYPQNSIVILNYPINYKNKKLNRNFNVDEFNFIYAGVITKSRCIFEMLETFYLIHKHYVNSHLHLVGPISPSPLAADIKSYIEEMNLKEFVHIYGMLTVVELYEIYNKCHFGLAFIKPLGNYIESVSTKIFDYMLFGLPFAVTDFPVYNEYVREANTGILVNNDPIESASLIMEVIGNANKMETMSQNGIKYTSSYWNWDTQADKLIKMYNQILG